jgi:formate dehydrogenase iron-sulfur subunit
MWKHAGAAALSLLAAGALSHVLPALGRAAGVRKGLR